MFAGNASSFADINLTREIVVVLIFIPSQAPLPCPQTKCLGQLRVILTEPEQAERVIAQSCGEAIAPVPGSGGPRPVLLRKIGRKKACVRVVGVGLIVGKLD